MDIKAVNRLFNLVRALAVAMISVGFIMLIVLAGGALGEVLGLPFLVYVVLLLRLNWLLQGNKIKSFWLVAALCVPAIGLLISYAAIRRAVIKARKQPGMVVSSPPMTVG